MSGFSEKLSLASVPRFCGKLAKNISCGDRISFCGEIGSGKTTLLYHLLKILGMKDDIDFSSPTFTIHNIYEIGGKIFHHIDLYRLENFLEFETLDLLPVFQPSQEIVFVEWGDKFEELKAFYNKKIHFSYLPGTDDLRQISYEDLS